MADGKWKMTEDEARRIDLSHNESNTLNLRKLPNFGLQKAVDNRTGNARLSCAFCDSDELQTGFGGCGDGFGYKSFKCKRCGGTTDFVYKDDMGRYL